MSANPPMQLTSTESDFATFDRMRLVYRTWKPVTEPSGRVLIFLHRGHEHSGRVAALVSRIAGSGDLCFAWDARGHGRSPGVRGDAPDFMALVRDLDAFVKHVVNTHGVDVEDIFIVANSVAAVVTATWLHDYAPRIRGVATAAAAFSIKLYVPLAEPALRLGLKAKPDLKVTSYVRPSMITHSKREAEAYASDPLVTRDISARVLVDLADTARRVVADAHAIDTPVLMLVAGKDVVVRTAPQRAFFDALSSTRKQWLEIPESKHAIFHEEETQLADAACRHFIEVCFANALPEPARYLDNDLEGPSATLHATIAAGVKRPGLSNRLQRALLRRIGHLSDGMKIGLTQGFDSGASLDYVYRNRASGRFGVGAMLDRGYLDATGWRGVRVRKVHTQALLSELIRTAPQGATLRILDVATGSGRYLLETLAGFKQASFDVELRDMDPANLAAAEKLATQLKLGDRVQIRYVQADAFNPPEQDADASLFDIAVVSGLYELFPENAPVFASLKSIARAVRPGGALVYTGQPWHPQLRQIAETLDSHLGGAWVMRPRPQNELDALVQMAGFKKTATEVGPQGIFTVSVARRIADPHGNG